MRRLGALLAAVTLLALAATSSGQVNSPYTESYTYDALGRLQSVTHDQNNPNGSSYEGFQYDPAGNRLQKEIATTSAAITAGPEVEAGGMLQFTVQLSGNTSARHTFTVQATPGANASASDFVAPASQLVIEANTPAATINVQTNNPGRYEPVKQVVVSITPTDANVVVTQGQATGLITNVNNAPSFSVAVAQSSIPQNGTAQFVITETNPSDLAHTINYTTSDRTSDGGLSSGVGPNRDYDATSGSLTFLPLGPASQPINIATHAPTITGQKMFAFTISTAGDLADGATITTDTATETIFDPNAGHISIAPVTVNEGATAILTLTRTTSTGTQTVTYRTCAITSCPDDPTLAGRYDAVSSGTATFADGSTTTTISIPTHADAGWHPNQTFNVNLLSISPGGTIDTATAQVTIVDLQSPSVFSVFSLSGNIYVGQSLYIGVTRGSGTAATTVSYHTTDGTAVGGTDYTAVSGTLSFPAGTNFQLLTINTLPTTPPPGAPARTAYVDFSGDNGATFSPTGRDTFTIMELSDCVRTTFPPTPSACPPPMTGTMYGTEAQFCDGSVGLLSLDYSGCTNPSSSCTPSTTTQNVACSSNNANWSGTAVQTTTTTCSNGQPTVTPTTDWSTCCKPTVTTQNVACSSHNTNWSGTAVQTGTTVCPSGSPPSFPNAPDWSTCNQCTPTSQSSTFDCSALGAGYSGSAPGTRNYTCPSGTWSGWSINWNVCSYTPPCTPTTITRNVACSSNNANWSGTAVQTGTATCPDGTPSYPNPPDWSTCNQCTPSTSQPYTVTCASVDPGTVGTAYVTQSVSCPGGTVTNHIDTSGCAVPPPACPSTSYQTYSCADNSGLHCLSGLITYQTVAACNGTTTTTVYNSSCAWTPGCVE